MILTLPTLAASHQGYHGGVYDDPACSGDPSKGWTPDHAVAVIGYDDESFLIKNSFGPQWGEDGGYLRLARGKNMCGIANMPFVPIA